MIGLFPIESNSFGQKRGWDPRRASVDPQNLTRVSFCDVSSFRAVNILVQRAPARMTQTSVHQLDAMWKKNLAEGKDHDDGNHSDDRAGQDKLIGHALGEF